MWQAPLVLDPPCPGPDDAVRGASWDHEVERVARGLVIVESERRDACPADPHLFECGSSSPRLMQYCGCERRLYVKVVTSRLADPCVSLTPAVFPYREADVIALSDGEDHLVRYR